MCYPCRAGTCSRFSSAQFSVSLCIIHCTVCVGRTGAGGGGGGGGGGGRKCSRELNIVKTVSTTVQLSTKLNMEHFSI